MSGTLSKLSPANLSLKERLKLKSRQPALILDISGSMNSDCEPGHSKIDALRSIVNNIKVFPPTYVFNSEPQKLKDRKVPKPRGGTVMSRVLDLVKKNGHKKVIMITDGECNNWDKENALEAVKGIELSVLYVGAGPKPEFLDQLVNAGKGGYCTQEDLSRPLEIEGKLTLLLESGEGTGTINL
jgi:hypothetical protein